MKDGRTWVLDTETKGTGATMVPLDEVERRERVAPKKLWVPPKRTPREPKPPEPRAPRRFRVVDVVSRQVLQDDGGVRATLELLGRVERMHDVTIYVWEPDEERWRLLTMDEHRLLWSRRRPADPRIRRDESERRRRRSWS
jgi:hypothetical protein